MYWGRCAVMTPGSIMGNAGLPKALQVAAVTTSLTLAAQTCGRRVGECPWMGVLDNGGGAGCAKGTLAVSADLDRGFGGKDGAE